MYSIADAAFKCYLLAHDELKNWKNMKKVLNLLVAATLALPALAFAETGQSSQATPAQVQAAQGTATAQAELKNDTITLISPRTGIRYTMKATERPIILRTAAIAAVNNVTVNRIVASNPALSAASQEQAKQSLLGTETALASN